MDINRLHRGVRRVLARASNVAQRRTTARHWTMPSTSTADIGSQHRTDWRRRLLTARGQQIHLMSVERNDRCAIAILDATGVVIAWHDHLPRAQPNDAGVVSRHVSQFYLAADVALHVPVHHLSIAADYGVDTQRGWRRRPSGEIFWGVTILQSILLKTGELVGYSHVTRSARAPAQHVFRPLRVRFPGTASIALMA